MGTPCSGPQSSPLASAPSAFATFVQETNHGHVCVAFENGRIEERADRSFRNPGFAQDERYPVVCVNWDDAKAFVVWLSKKTGKPYRLLSGAEREYVTRAGTTTRYSLGNDDRALCRYGNVGDQTAKKSIKGAEKWTIADRDDGYARTAPVATCGTGPKIAGTPITMARPQTARRVVHCRSYLTSSGRPRICCLSEYPCRQADRETCGRS
jgi:hypothetical protein